VVKAARFLHLAGDERRASQFLRHAAEGQPAATRAALAQMAIDLGAPQIGIRICKDAAADGVILPDQYYPLHAVAEEDWPVATEYMMAIARQESELDPRAASSVGARGLMQLMPATAEHMAGEVGVPYSPARLGVDPVYNARLGTAYLAQMLDRYDGSYVLATAAYNAGPGRVDQWLKANGDPREPGADSVVWIESIPFTETRNYVMRVMEGVQVYRARLGGAEPVEVVSETSGGTG
jgi:soluble lytic murein transglycosylase